MFITISDKYDQFLLMENTNANHRLDQLNAIQYRSYMIKTYLYALLFAVFTTLLPSLSYAADNWDMPMAYDEANYHTQNGKLFAKAVTLCTNNAMTINVKAGGKLLKGNEIKSAVQNGQVNIGERLLSAHKNENPLFGIDSVPFLATSFDQSEHLWRTVRPELDKILNRQNIKLLYSVPWPPQGIFSNKPISSINDLEGVKFRDYSPTTKKIAELTGAIPVRATASNLMRAVKNGEIETFIASSTTGNARKMWRDVKYYYDLKLWVPRNYVFVNKDAWAALSDQHKRCVTSAALIAEQAGSAKAQQLSDNFTRTLSDKGMIVVEPDDAMKAEFDALGVGIIAEWQERTGTYARDIIDAYRNR